MNEPNTSAGNGPGAAPPADDAGALQDRLKAAEQERDQFRALSQRVQAEFENYQKRSSRELQQERRYWHSGLALDLLTALDNLERAVAAAKKAGEKGPLAEGVALVQSQVLDILKRHGITPIETAGKPFDPTVHQAVMQQLSDKPAGTVLQVLQQGFMIHDRVLRPASVIVAAEKA